MASKSSVDKFEPNMSSSALNWADCSPPRRSSHMTNSRQRTYEHPVSSHSFKNALSCCFSPSKKCLEIVLPAALADCRYLRRAGAPAHFRGTDLCSPTQEPTSCADDCELQISHSEIHAPVASTLDYKQKGRTTNSKDAA
jgi:hypothetical protein